MIYETDCNMYVGPRIGNAGTPEGPLQATPSYFGGSLKSGTTCVFLGFLPGVHDWYGDEGFFMLADGEVFTCELRFMREVKP